MIRTAPKPRPSASMLALMTVWLRDTSDTPWTFATDREVVEYRIECLYPGGLSAFRRDHAR